MGVEQAVAACCTGRRARSCGQRHSMLQAPPAATSARSRGRRKPLEAVTAAAAAVGHLRSKQLPSPSKPPLGGEEWDAAPPSPPETAAVATVRRHLWKQQLRGRTTGRETRASDRERREGRGDARFTCFYWARCIGKVTAGRWHMFYWAIRLICWADNHLAAAEV
jgi:hypothetical protein